MIKLHEVHKVYTQGKVGYHALKNIDLFFEKGEFVSIFGPSGCGKTTLLNIMGGLDNPTSGEMVIDDRLTTEFVEKEWDYFRNHRIGFIFQQYNLIEHLPIVENVALSLKLGGKKSKFARKEAIALLEKVGLKDHLHKLPGELSGGERQRVAIARALINDPDIILADEPTGALDHTTGTEVMDLIKSICSDKLVIVVTHNRKMAELYSTRIIELKDGRVVSDSKPNDSKVKITKVRTKLRKKLSFKEAVKLSYYNIKGKFWRTILVSLGLSVGVVGLILVDALFNSIRDGLSQQESIVSNNPDVYVHIPQEDGADVQALRDELIATGYYKDILYAPRNEYTIQYDVTNDTLLSYPITLESIQLSQVDEISNTFTTLIGDSRLPINDNEIVLNMSTAKKLINQNLSLTNDEIWNTLNGNQFTIYDDYNYVPTYNSLFEQMNEGMCVVTEPWDGDITTPPVNYDEVILGSFNANILQLNVYRDSQIVISETESIFCADYSLLSWSQDYNDPSNEGTIVTIVGIHENALFPEMILSDNVLFTTSEALQTIDPDGDYNAYEKSIRFRAFIKNDLIEDKTTIQLAMQDKGYFVQENRNSFNVFQGLTDLFMYILQFIFSCIVAIAVITGGLMLLLILLISILERSREIGLIRAMGGTRSDIRVIYTGETTIIGLLAGLFSIILSIICVYVLNIVIYNNYLDLILKHLPFVDPKHLLTINYPKLIWAIVGSILIAIISGLIPAMRASRKKPIEALRNE
jgi:putative ABC transport system permease protein